MKRISLTGFVAAMLFALTLTVYAQETSVALIPQDRNKEDWWKNRFVEKVEQMKKGDIDLLLIGDSITHGWEGHKQIWDKFYADRKTLNFGFSGDRTEHVLWRLDNAPMDAIHPKAITIMIGTNNIGHGSSQPKDAADGVLAIVQKLQKLYPDAKIFVLYVFPRDEKPDGRLRAKVNEINAYLPKLLANLNNVVLVDIGYLFLQEDGTLPKSIMPDSLHPNDDGYVVWGNAVEPFLKPIFEK
ncbi:MAG: GDSL-type esterase/lipase family protein [Planctomycetaceae bacterium]|nr:GDSL-type esterase/lipase family protein [Planctomycetaceae bacterium]